MLKGISIYFSKLQLVEDSEQFIYSRILHASFCCETIAKQHTSPWVFRGFLGVVFLFRRYNADVCLSGSVRMMLLITSKRSVLRERFCKNWLKYHLIKHQIVSSFFLKSVFNLSYTMHT